jgi:hypothetical protein
MPGLRHALNLTDPLPRFEDVSRTLAPRLPRTPQFGTAGGLQASGCLRRTLEGIAMRACGDDDGGWGRKLS